MKPAQKGTLARKLQIIKELQALFKVLEDCGKIGVELKISKQIINLQEELATYYNDELENLNN